LQQPSTDRYLGAGRHPISGSDAGFITAYVQAGGDAPAIGATLFNIWGQPAHYVTVSDGASPISDANPVAAALPDGGYAVAWGDFDGDGSDAGIALRRVDADGGLGPLGAANARGEFSQLNPDILWTGSNLVVAWEDYADASNGPDLRYRVFDAQLNPLADDASLAETSLPEAAVALSTFNGGWAAAYREGASDGREQIVVKAGDATFRIGPVFGGPLEDRPALVELDSTHLLVTFSVGTDPGAIGLYNTPRLRYAIVDTAGSATPALAAFDPMDLLLSTESQTAQLSPALVRHSQGIYLAWRSEARPGDAAGDQIWLKFMRWQAGSVPRLDVEEPELLIPRACDGSAGDQRRPALTTTSLPPGNALAIAWEDYGKTVDQAAGEPDVLVHYAPTHRSVAGDGPRTVTETWSNATGTAWPAHWSSYLTGPVVLTNQYGEGEFFAQLDPGSSRSWINDHTAQNVDLVTTIRHASYTNYAGLIARQADNDDDSYLWVSFSTRTPQPWTLSATIDGGTPTVIKSYALPASFSNNGIGVLVDYRVRFRVLTNPDGTLFIGMRYWRVGASEPTTWTMSDTLPTSSPIVQRFGNVAGRFGIWAKNDSANGGRTSFDDFKATFFEGSGTGDLEQAAPLPLRLPRSSATYKTCSSATPCAEGAGCCDSNADCAAGLTCSARHAADEGFGSYASTCSLAHCANGLTDGGETRADCGGPDCAACECTSTLTKGAAGYCGVAPCLCGAGDYPCSRDANCLPGLLCGFEAGEPFGSSTGVSACVPPHCMNRVLDADKGETLPDCGGPCGSNCNVCSATNGAVGHCRPYCACGLGNGHCRQDDECAAPLRCSSQYTRGTRFGLAASTNICLPAHCFNNVKDAALGETTTDCGGPCGCGGCAAGCQSGSAPQGAAITIPTVTPYTESFNAIGTAAVATLPTGWRVDSQPNPRTVGTYAAASTATITRAGALVASNITNSIYNFGSGNAATGAGYWLDSADRAVGWVATGATVGSGGTKSGNLYLQLQAPSNVDINGVTVSYKIEKYRSGTTAPGWKVQLFYSADGVNWASADPTTFTTAFAADANANGFDPAPGSTTTVSGSIPVYVLRNTALYLAWSYTVNSPTLVDSTSSQALAVDDVSVVGKAAP
jgi:hypothetical protein